MTHQPGPPFGQALWIQISHPRLSMTTLFRVKRGFTLSSLNCAAYRISTPANDRADTKHPVRGNGRRGAALPAYSQPVRTNVRLLMCSADHEYHLRETDSVSPAVSDCSVCPVVTVPGPECGCTRKPGTYSPKPSTDLPGRRTRVTFADGSNSPYPFL